MIDPESLRRVVLAALEEDLGAGDITSRAVIPEGTQASGRIIAREALVIAGLPVARQVFLEVDPRVAFREGCHEGDLLRSGDDVARVEGPAISILAAERTALNFLQRLSGIATATRRLVRLAEGSGALISDTRKTAPGLRLLDKHAVRVGGGSNHRAGLYDGVLIKDNHWRLAGGVGEAVRRARAAFRGRGAPKGGIQVEVGTIEEVREALEAGADALLLDNMDAPTLQKALSVARGRAFLEVSGGMGAGDIPRLAAAGVDRISVGFLTHSARAADIALELEPA